MGLQPNEKMQRRNGNPVDQLEWFWEKRQS